jgi:tetratricopeptide (TPR) repeat protein
MESMRRLLPVVFLLACWCAPARAESVLILPFFNQSSSTNLDWVSESVCQTISEALAARGVLVLEREDRLEAYRRLSIRPNARLTHASVMRVAEALDADEVIYGQFQFTPAGAGAPEGSRGSLSFTAWTLSMRRMRQAPPFMESGPLDGLAALQTHLAWQALGYLDPDATPPAEQFQKEHPPVRLDAMENYTRGLLTTDEEQKHRYFAQAARLDENFSSPDFELGRLYWGHKEYRLAAQWFVKVKPAAQRYMEANFLLGLCRYYTGDYAAAQQSFEMVAQSVPLNEVFNDLAAVQSKRGLPEALENFRKALDGDPGDPDYHFNTGYVLWKRGEFAEAADRFRAVLDRNPEDAHATLLLGRCLAKSGPRVGEIKEGFERVKLNFDEGAWRQLKAALNEKKPR